MADSIERLHFKNVLASSNLLTNIGRRHSLPLDTSTVVQHGGKRKQSCVLMEPLDL